MHDEGLRFKHPVWSTGMSGTVKDTNKTNSFMNHETFKPLFLPTRWFHFNFTSCSFTPWEVLFGSRPVPPRFPSYEPDKVGALRQLWDKKPVQTLPNRSPRDDCNLWSTALCGYNLAILANVQTFERCRQVCQVFEDCFFWTWNPQNRLCFIKDEHARCGRRDTVVLDVVSGPKDCVGDQFR